MKVYSIGRAALAAAVILAGASQASGPGDTLGRKLTTNDRMKEVHLKAATEDAAKYQSQRKPVVLQSGLNDYRSICHAHAEDATHTGGTRPEMLAEAKKANVACIMLTDHHRPPKDFITQTWRGMHDGVLFIPGSESNGYLVYPENSIMDKMKLEGMDFVKEVTKGDGLIFLSHVESKFGHSFEGLTGMEIYNRHFDAMDDMLSLLSLAPTLTNPKLLAAFTQLLDKYHEAMFASQYDYSPIYMNMWDREAQNQRVVGVAANDCHHNMIMIAKMLDEETVLVGTNVDPDKDLRRVTAALTPSVRELTKGHKAGDIVARLDFDPYYYSFRDTSTHILAKELAEPAIRAALKQGHAYVSHDWLCDPTGFVYAARKEGDAKLAAVMGDEVKFDPALRLVAEFPAACDVRLLKNGEEIAKANTREFTHTPDGPGVYRLEGWFKVDGEDRAWIYANPIYVR